MRAWNSSSPDCLVAIICRIWANEVNIESSNSAVGSTILISLLLPLLLIACMRTEIRRESVSPCFCHQTAGRSRGGNPPLVGHLRPHSLASQRAGDRVSDFGIRSVWSGGTSIPGAFFDWLGEVPGQSPFSDEGSPWHFWLQARAIGSGCGLGSDGAALVVDFAQGGERMCRQLVSAGQGRDRLSHRARSSWAAVRTGCAPRCK